VREVVGVAAALQHEADFAVGPHEQFAVQPQRVGRLGEIVTLEMQLAQFVHIANVHFLSVDLVVEVLQIIKSV